MTREQAIDEAVRRYLCGMEGKATPIEHVRRYPHSSPQDLWDTWPWSITFIRREFDAIMAEAE